MSRDEQETHTSKSRQVVDSIENKIADTFPWLKTSLGGLWTIFWLIIAFTVEVIAFLIPIILAIAGIVFIIVLIAQFDGDLSFDLPIFIGSGKKKEKNKKDHL